MIRPEPDSRGAQVRARAAAEWLVRRDRGLTAGEQDQFLQWLADNPLHGEWLALHRNLLGDFGALAEWRPEHSEEPNPDLLARTRPRPLRGVGRWLLAAAAVAVLVGVTWRLTQVAQKVEPVAAVEGERRILEDGSSVELNRGAAVTMAFSESERRVVLVRGEALFSVMHNPSRPFIVRAGGVDVRAIGTAFSVRLGADAVEVLVTEGRVSVNAPGNSGPDARHDAVPETRGPTTPSELKAGERAIVALTGGGPPRVVSVSPEESARLLAWQPKLLDFSSAPLARAVEEFNRRNRVQFVLADPALAAMPIVASIRSDNVEGFARFLADAPGVEVERTSETVIILRRKR